jgi:hypothetical protein
MDSESVTLSGYGEVVECGYTAPVSSVGGMKLLGDVFGFFG